MGAWGYDPWDNDEAADWFGNFMKHVDIDFIIQTVEEVEIGNLTMSALEQFHT